MGIEECFCLVGKNDFGFSIRNTLTICKFKCGHLDRRGARQVLFLSKTTRQIVQIAPFCLSFRSLNLHDKI